MDERSIELTLGGESMVALVNEHRNLVVVRSLCEPFAMPGIPISYCIAHPDTIAQITRFYDSSCVPMFAEVIGELALTETEHLERTREFLDSEIPWLQCMLNLIPGIDIFPAEANYVMCTFDAGPDLALGVANTDELAQRLQLAGFLVRKLEGRPRSKTAATSALPCARARTTRSWWRPCARSSWGARRATRLDILSGAPPLLSS